MTLRDEVHAHEKRIIRDALTRHRGNVRQTALEFGLHERSLWRRLSAHGIDPEPFRMGNPDMEAASMPTTAEIDRMPDHNDAVPSILPCPYPSCSNPSSVGWVKTFTRHICVACLSCHACGPICATVHDAIDEWNAAQRPKTSTDDSADAQP